MVFARLADLIKTWPRLSMLRYVANNFSYLFPWNHNHDFGIMHRKRRGFGGIFTIVGIIFVAALLAALLVPAIADNERERRSLIPSVIVDPKFRPIASRVTILLTAEGFIGQCTIADTESSFKLCNSLISTQISNFNVTSGTTQTCSRTKLPGDERGNCTVKFVCDRCAFTSETASIAITNTALLSYASAYTIQILTSAAYPSGESQFSYRITPDQNKFFRGIATTTVLTMTTVQTTYSQKTPAFIDSGFHIDFSNVALGEQADFRTFSSKNGYKFAVTFNRVPNSLEIVKDIKKNVVTIISEILGSLVGIIGLVGVTMVC